jgi:hypothetical protein
MGLMGMAMGDGEDGKRLWGHAHHVKKVLQLQKFDLEQPREGDQSSGSSMARG